MSKVNLLFGSLYIIVSVMIIRTMLSEWSKMKKSGEVIFESSIRSNQNWGNVVFYSVLLIVSIKNDLLVHWMYHGMQIMFIVLIFLFVVRGIRKTQICEKAIVSPDFVIEWSDVKDYEWEGRNKKYRILRIELYLNSNSIFGYKNKNVRLKIMRSEIAFVDGIIKRLLAQT